MPTTRHRRACSPALPRATSMTIRCASSPPIWRRSICRVRQPWDYKLQTLPRPKGRATRVVITEYDMPEKTIAPHDVRIVRDGQNGDGYVWYSDFVENFLGRLEPQERRGRRISDSGVQAGLPDRHARSRSRCRRQSVARFDVSDRARALRYEDQDLQDLSAAGRSQRRRHAAIHGDAGIGECRRQGLDQRRGAAVDHAARCEDRRL